MPVSIHDLLLNALLSKLAGGVPVWIGLYTVLDNGTWSWLDNTKMDFVNWYPGSPSGHHTCAVMTQSSIEAQWAGVTKTAAGLTGRSSASYRCKSHR